MPDSLSPYLTGWTTCVQTARPTIVRATPVVVIILVLVQQALSRVQEVSVIFGR